MARALMWRVVWGVGVGAAGVLLSCVVGAESFVPIVPHTGMTLGSALNVLKPSSALPSCFKFSVVDIDPPAAARQYSVDVHVASSVAEVRQLRQRSGAVSASYGTFVSGNLQGWENRESSEQRAALYVVLEARSIGARKQLSGSPEPLTPELAKLLSTGSPQAIVRRCGTHLATTEHRGQTLRVIMDLSQADSLSKQELVAQFKAKARFGLFGGGASANYKSVITSLSRQNRLDLLIEGTGQPPRGRLRKRKKSYAKPVAAVVAA